MAKEKYKLQTPSYIKDSVINKELSFNKAFLSRCKSGEQELSEERLIELNSLILAIRNDMKEYQAYINMLLGDKKKFDSKKTEKFYSSLSVIYKEIHEKG